LDLSYSDQKVFDRTPEKACGFFRDLKQQCLQTNEEIQSYLTPMEMFGLTNW